MNYTLDSLVHAESCLREKLNIKEVSSTPIIAQLKELTKKRNVYYFGVLTIGHNVQNVNLNLLGTNIIRLENNNQIICLFDTLTFTQEDKQGTSGQFRGFEIITEDSGFII